MTHTRLSALRVERDEAKDAAVASERVIELFRNATVQGPGTPAQKAELLDREIARSQFRLAAFNERHAALTALIANIEGGPGA